MDKKTFIAAISAMALAVAAGGVLAKERAGAGAPQFSALDADGDGQVTRSEMDAHRASRLLEADRDGDGLLSLAELQADGRARADDRAEQMLERHDENGDGLLAPDEMGEGRAGRFFERIDRNGDGAIDKAEFDEARARMQARGPRHGDR